MQIRHGHLIYEVIATDRPIIHPETGKRCLALAWPDDGRIEFDANATTDRVWGRVGHELGHLLKNDLDITDSAKLDEESLCNLFGLAMSMMDFGELARLHVYVTHGIDAPSVMMLPNVSFPIPILKITQEN